MWRHAALHTPLLCSHSSSQSHPQPALLNRTRRRPSAEEGAIRTGSLDPPCRPSPQRDRIASLHLTCTDPHPGPLSPRLVYTITITCPFGGQPAGTLPPELDSSTASSGQSYCLSAPRRTCRTPGIVSPPCAALCATRARYDRLPNTPHLPACHGCAKPTSLCGYHVCVAP